MFQRAKRPISVLSSLTFAAFSLITIPQNAFAWGKLGHEVIGEVAAQLASHGRPFWEINKHTLAELTMFPDTVWKQPQTGGAKERPTHWFHQDAYDESPLDVPNIFSFFDKVVAKYSEQEVVKNGTAAWRAEQMYRMAIVAFEQKEFLKGLQLTGALAHYVADVSQPLHVTTNHDGQLTNNDGLHKYFETTNFASRGREYVHQKVFEQARLILADKTLEASFNKSFINGMFREIKRSSLSLKTLLETDTNLGRDAAGSQAQLELAIERAADGAATLALVLSNVWKEAGVSEKPKQALPSKVPAWVPPQYSDLDNNQKEPQENLPDFNWPDCE